MQDQVMQLAQMLQDARYPVFFGGAGVSTESGIPDFRSTDGLYHQRWRDPPETVLSHQYFMKRTDTFYDFYREKMIFPDVKPSGAHTALAQLERMGKMRAIITQNIDGLHQMAGSTQVLELHGSIHRNRCMKCRAAYDLTWLMGTTGVPHCTCGGLVKPEVVLYGEPLDDKVTARAIREIQKADLLIVGGTSLSVYPAAGYVRLCAGDLVLINKTPTAYDEYAQLVVRERIGVFLTQVVAHMQA
ncbi:MAG TPA: NAD-dependent protein deacylase [Clostridiales bacterium]|jgi:NAD-dependent deacetylase|nr:NAD-dependent protein deacylase [Clostridiales bacterium]